MTKTEIMALLSAMTVALVSLIGTLVMTLYSRRSAFEQTRAAVQHSEMEARQEFRRQLMDQNASVLVRLDACEARHQQCDKDLREQRETTALLSQELQVQRNQRCMLAKRVALLEAAKDPGRSVET